MSKYNKDYYYDTDENEPIISGESVIWKGKPKKSAFIINNAMVMFPFALLWLLFDGTFITIIIKTGAIKEMLFFIIPFFLFHLMPVWIWLSNLLTANRKWKNTKYYVTDKRIIIQNGFIAENYQTIYYKDIRKVNLHIGIIDKMLGVGDIHFDIGSSGSNAGSFIASFLDIEDYKELYARLQKTVLDIQTDIEFPNALRPDTNPGYNTKYTPDNK